jgi:signal transduction histidine kinase
LKPTLRLPFLAQVLILLAVTVFAVQVMTVVMIGLLPRPRPTTYRARDVAAALAWNGAGRLDPRTIRLEQASAPAPANDVRFEAPATRRILAELLSVPESRVWFSLQNRRRTRAILNNGLSSPFAPPPRPAAAPRTQRPGRPPWLGPGPAAPAPASPQARLKFEETWPIFGSFTAALQQPDGRWVVVHPKPEPFPNADQRRIVLWLFGCVLLVIPIAYVFARRITAPILNFAQAAEALGRDPNAPPSDIEGPAEIARAAKAFNLMQSRVRALIEDRTAMLGAISHDLRTPLARIRFRVERDPVASRAAILQDLRQMEQMLSQVLTFVRGASEANERVPLELRSVLECVVDGALPPERARLEDGPPLYVRGDPLELTRLFSNLVDNAIKYGNSAVIRLKVDAGVAMVEVSDDGPGLKPEELEKVFAPFYRADASRNSVRGGVGLGLSVARSIARSHGGDVNLSPGEGGGLTAVVSLPLQLLAEGARELPA